MCYLPSSESGENLHCLSEHLECEISHHIYTCTSPLIRQLNMGTPTVVSYFVSCTLLRSLQVEVSVSLLPPVADAGWCNVVLVLSSAAPVNWALVTPGLRGHITVHVRHLSLFFFSQKLFLPSKIPHFVTLTFDSTSQSLPQSSHSVTPLYPPKPDLTMSSIIVPDLLAAPDLLAWANQNGYPSVMSYTEAHLANRFVIKLKGGGAGKATILASLYPCLCAPCLLTVKCVRIRGTPRGDLMH